MTATELQHIVRRLANSALCRYWLHWNHPHEAPWLMALRVVDFGGPETFRQLDEDLSARGMRRDNSQEDWFAGCRDVAQRFYLVERTDEVGRAFKLPEASAHHRGS